MSVKSVLRLPPLPSIRDLVKLYRLTAIKQLSQNFLLDERMSDKIVRAAGKLEGRCVCEVGPGPGGITRSILRKGASKVLLIERDSRFKGLLSMLQNACPGRVDTYWGDVLSFNMSKLFPEEATTPWDDDRLPPLHILGNLPFSVATPLIIRWLRDMSERTNAWTYGRVPLTLTFQKEVAERIVANVMDTQRSRLSIMCQYLTEPEYKFTISGSAFVPKPDVDVGVVRFIPRKVPLISYPFPVVEKVTRQIFSKKRKMSYKGAATLFPKVIRNKLVRELYSRTDVNPEIRPTQVTIEEIGLLCKAYLEVCEEYPVRDYVNRAYEAEDQWETKYGSIYGYSLSFRNRMKGKMPGEEPKFDYDDEDLEDNSEDNDDVDFNFKEKDSVMYHVEMKPKSVTLGISLGIEVILFLTIYQITADAPQSDAHKISLKNTSSGVLPPLNPPCDPTDNCSQGLECIDYGIKMNGNQGTKYCDCTKPDNDCKCEALGNVYRRWIKHTDDATTGYGFCRRSDAPIAQVTVSLLLFQTAVIAGFWNI
ncbi:unnamed protein product [Allacma fusca]|uniref:rRNA adenine N(6)-methyltransferase n=1 Tax=Allacma fusca TaxID=39272 RepID=A0A8J2KCW3_9HEXA|nr:unnamed protein product [Allacma fusca]